GPTAAQSETGFGRATGSFEPVKTLEDVGMFGSGNSGPLIGDRKERLAIAPSHLNGHPAGFAAMLDGIVDEIGGGLEQKVSIARDEYVLIADEAQTRTGFLRRRIEQFDDL